MKKYQVLIALCIIGLFSVAFVILPEFIHPSITCKESNTIKTDSKDKYSLINIEKEAFIKASGENKEDCNQLQISIPVLVKEDHITFADNSLESFNQTSISEKKHETKVLFSHEIIEGNKLTYYVNYALKDKEKNTTYEIEETLEYQSSDHAFHFVKSDK